VEDQALLFPASAEIIVTFPMPKARRVGAGGSQLRSPVIIILAPTAWV
jgi:hypothetical protein